MNMDQKFVGVVFILCCVVGIYQMIWSQEISIDYVVLLNFTNIWPSPQKGNTFFIFVAYQIVDKASPAQPDEKLTTTKLSAEQRNSARVAMIKKGCSLNTNKLKFSTLRQLQHNLTNNLGLDAKKYFSCLAIENLRASLYPT